MHHDGRQLSQLWGPLKNGCESRKNIKISENICFCYFKVCFAKIDFLENISLNFGACKMIQSDLLVAHKTIVKNDSKITPEPIFEFRISICNIMQHEALPLHRVTTFINRAKKKMIWTP